MKHSLSSAFGRVCLLLLLPVLVCSRSECQIYSDDQLVQMGTDKLKSSDFPMASVYLFAYIQRNPQLMSAHPKFAKEVQVGYQYALDQVNQTIKERDQLKGQLAQARAEADGKGMTQAEIRQPPPRIEIPQSSSSPMSGAKSVAIATLSNTIGGSWKYKMTSSVAQDSHEGFLKLSLAGTAVSGSMSTWDNTNGAVQGTFSGNTLEFERDTGLDTIQHFKLIKQDDRYMGSFWNTGKYEDSGNIEMVRVQ
jgi:hypothetical protein